MGVFFASNCTCGTIFTSPYTYTLSNQPVGTYSITAKATDNNGAQTVSAPITVKVSAPSIVSNEPAALITPISVSKDVSVSVAPNPAINILNVYTSGFINDKLVAIGVITTNVVIIKTIKLIGAVEKMEVDVPSMTRGVYIIKVVGGDKIISKQFVKFILESATSNKYCYSI